jgi:cytochrome P450
MVPMMAVSPSPAPAVSPAASIPVIGSIRELRSDQLGLYLRGQREHGDIVRVSAGPPGLRLSFYAVFHPDDVQKVLTSRPVEYRKDNPHWAVMRQTVGDGLPSSQDERWRRQRRVAQPLFTPRAVGGYAGIVAEETDAMTRRWFETPGRVVDAHHEMTALLLQTVGRALFGSSLHRAVPVIEHSFPVLSEYMLYRGFAPVRGPRWLPTRANRRAERARRELYAVCDEIIAERLRSGSSGDDLLSRLLDARAGGEHEMDDDEVRAQLLWFMLAGHETTACTLTFALHLIGRHPEVQRRLQEEADRVLAGRPATSADLAQLAYTAMVVKEATRLYPSIPVLSRTVVGGDTLAGHAVPDGAAVWVMAWVTHRHPDFWDDPERFDPERFTRERVAGRHRFAWFPFGGGPRGCIGEHFAMLETVEVLAAIMGRCHVEALDPQVPVTTGMTLRAATAVRCRVTRRS